MKQEVKVNLHNRFDIEVVDLKTGQIKQRAYAENIILNQAWEQILGDAGNWFYHIKAGSGTGTLAAARTALFNQILTKLAFDPVFTKNIDENWYSYRQRIDILENENVGTVFTEVGIGTATVLCTHAMLKDMNGNQVSITKTDTDIIKIYATVYGKLAGTWTRGAAIEFIRRSDVCNYSIKAIMGSRVEVASYTPSSFPDFIAASKEACNNPKVYDYPRTALTKTTDTANKRITFYHRIPAASANVDGLRTYVLIHSMYRGGYSTQYTEAVIGNMSGDSLTQSQTVEQIGVGNGVVTDFATTFPFVKSGAVIKVDGTVASPSVLLGLPKVKDIKGYMYNCGDTGNGEISVNNLFPSSTNALDLILENPFYVNYGIDSIIGSDIKMYTSTDKTNWTPVYTGTGTYTVGAEHKQKRYWKFTKEATTPWAVTAMNCDALDALKNVRFAAAPATGAVITAEYNTDCAVKDINHVLDITVVLQLGEYTP